MYCKNPKVKSYFTTMKTRANTAIQYLIFRPRTKSHKGAIRSPRPRLARVWGAWCATVLQRYSATVSFWGFHFPMQNLQNL